MRTEGRRLAWVGVLLVLVSSLLGCGKESTTTATAVRPEFGSIRWPSFPVDLHPATEFLTGQKKRDLRSAMAFWEKHAGRKLFHVAEGWAGPGVPYTGSPDNPDSISENAVLYGESWGLETDIAGMTSLRVEGGSITGGFILVDPQTDFCTGLCSGDEEGTSLRRLLAHELGHFLGMPHSADPSNIMYGSVQPGGSLYDRTTDDGLLKHLTE